MCGAEQQGWLSSGIRTEMRTERDGRAEHPFCLVLASGTAAGQGRREIECPQWGAAIWLPWDPDVTFLSSQRMQQLFQGLLGGKFSLQGRGRCEVDIKIWKVIRKDWIFCFIPFRDLFHLVYCYYKSWEYPWNVKYDKNVDAFLLHVQSVWVKAFECFFF